MNSKLFFASAALFLLLGCSSAVRFYPVQGSLSTQTPVPVLLGKFTVRAHSGDITVVMHDGEVCKGHWSLVRPVQSGAGTAVAAETNGMPALWDAVYGSGFYVAHVLGSKEYVHAVVTGNKGTVLQVELFNAADEKQEGVPHAKGIAKDNKDNLYKVVL